MTDEDKHAVEQEMILTLLLALIKEREGEAKITPCGNCKTIEAGLTVDNLLGGKSIYMLYYNVGVDTHAVKLETYLAGEY